jgi:hypothetical protein
MLEATQKEKLKVKEPPVNLGCNVQGGTVYDATY